MAMLIKGGILHTMTQAGTFTGDVLIDGEQIAAVGPDLALPDDLKPCTLSARDLHVLPGLIDPHISEPPEEDEHLLRAAREAGVTAGLLWPEGEGCCRMMASGRLGPSRIYLVNPALYTDVQLVQRLAELQASGLRVAAQVHDEDCCRRLLRLVETTGIRMIFSHLTGCEGLEDAVAVSGCSVILGVGGSRSASPWAFAGRLAARGVPVCLTCNSPDAKLKHLPVCAALCIRDGMAREQALRTITANPADLLELPDAGRIAPGCRADLVLYDGDPLLLATSHVITIQNGRLCH